VDLYAELVCRLAGREDFDVVHAHDWMTFPAGIAITSLRHKPLVVHVHSTEFDRSGWQVNRRIYDIERRGMRAAATVIAVSNLTRNTITSCYGIAPAKVRVVYNAIDTDGPGMHPSLPPIERQGKIVLFLGRVTMQKGPEYFIAAARRVLEVMGDVRFIVAGSGDMLGRTMALAAKMGIAERVVFTGFLRGAAVARAFRMADLYVMPSVSEPFGLVALEAISHDVPVIVSKQSGVAEVLDHVLKVDFWDVADLAHKIIAVLQEPSLHAALRADGRRELSKLSWDDSARRCLGVYRAVV
jgi:glycosyltransferase involved in cell wall biosynthesis